jgi:hypothetical protein
MNVRVSFSTLLIAITTICISVERGKYDLGIGSDGLWLIKLVL